MTDTDSEKLDKIIWKLDKLGEGIAAMAGQIQNLSAAIAQAKTIPAPNLEQQRRR